MVDAQKGSDIPWDLRKRIPLPDGCVDKIYSSHFLEHVPYSDQTKLLADCQRVLRKGGEMLVCVPNARLFIDAYITKTAYLTEANAWLPAYVDTGSAIDQVNYIAYMAGTHTYMFDEENLVNSLKKTGFTSAELREFDPELDHARHRGQSIYAVARN